MKSYFTILAVLAAAAIAITGCNQPRHHHTPAEWAAHIDSLKTDLLNADIAFSKLSSEQGRNAAFLAYADSNCTMLRSNSMPITGIDSVNALMANHPDTAFTLTWMPIKADVARSGDLGYTYGTYQVNYKNGEKGEGTYCTVWKRNRQKQWKYVMDVGNEGLGKK